MMKTQKAPKIVLEDLQVHVKVKLAALWTSLMFLYLYVDHFHLFMPNAIEDILKGVVFKFEITQVFLIIALVSMTIPAVMIFLSVVLAAKINRRANILIAVLYIPYTLFNLAGEAWTHMVFAAGVEVALLCFIIRYAWKWPRAES